MRCPRCNEVREHPQPFQDATGRWLCGACWYMEGLEIEMEFADPFPIIPIIPEEDS